MMKAYMPVLPSQIVSSIPQEDSYLQKLLKPFSDGQNRVVELMTQKFLHPDTTSIYISAITGQVVIPETVFLTGCCVWLGSSCILPIIIPFLGFKAVLNSFKEEDAVGKSQSFSAFQHAQIFGLYVMILLCSVSMVPSIYLLFTGEGRELQDKGYITSVERFAPIGCATLPGFVLALQMISLSMKMVAKEAVDLEEQGGGAQGLKLQTKRDSWDKVDKLQKIIANRFWRKGVFIFKQYDTSVRRSDWNVEEAAGLISIREAAKLQSPRVAVVKGIFAIFIAAIPLSRHSCGSLSVFEHTCEYGTVSSVSALWATFATIGYAYTSGCTIYTILTASQLLIVQARKNRQLVLLALFLCSPVKTRKLLLRKYASDLDSIQCFVSGEGNGSNEWLSLREAEEEAEELIARQSSGHVPKQITLHNAVAELGQEVRVNLADELDLHTDKEEVKKMLQESYSALACFQTLDVGVFWLLRQRMKIYVLSQSMQIQLFLMSLFGFACAVFCGILMCTDRMELEILMASGLLLIVVPLIVLVFNTFIYMNGLLNEETIGAMFTWKDLLETSQWQVRCLTESREAKSYIETYFQRLKFQLDHIIQQIEKTEAPISICAVPITKNLRNSLLVGFFWVVWSMVQNEIKEAKRSPVDWLKGYVLNEQNARQANATLLIP